ncbi:MAG: hypothetical protein F4W90_03625 [Gammaproteobacteria bacterium]|nr:hypothetical protein [Gammaproteobacteria bacterium]
MSFDVPKPVITPLPLRMASYYPPQLETYVYEEEIANFGNFRIDMTGAHKTLFSTVFDSLFNQYTEIEQFKDVPANFHGIIAPVVQEVQITLPQQTRSDYYEVWIRYQLQLWDTSGRLVHTWSLPAYGKANKKNYNTIRKIATQALHDATEFALRDAAASMSFYFAKEPQVQAWIDELTGVSS